MKPYLLLLIATINLSLGTLSQNTKDTICLPTAQAQRLLIAAEQKKVLDEKVAALELRIVEKEGIIVDLQSKNLNTDKITLTYQSEIQLMKDQRAIFENQIKELNLEIKRQKRKAFWTSVAGVAAAIGIIYLTK